MPRLLSEQRLNQIQYVSIADYIRQIDELEDFEDKMAFTTRYLLAYGTEERDVPLAEAIHIAKVKIVEASAKIREKEIMVPDEAIDPHLSDEEDAANRLFIIEPVEYLQNEARRLISEENNNGINEESQRRINNYQMMSYTLMNGVNSGLSNQISELDIEPNALDVKLRLKAKYGSNRAFEKAYNATKPGFLAKMFGKYSRAYANLEETYNAFNNPEHVLYGDLNSLDKAAKEYLHHCFPKWDPKKGMISKSSIERLSGTKKDRAMFSFNILKVNSEQRLTEKYYDNIISANIQRRADIEANIIEDNNSFQNNLNEDVNLDSSQIEKDYHDNFVIENDNEIEME